MRILLTFLLALAFLNSKSQAPSFDSLVSLNHRLDSQLRQASKTIEVMRERSEQATQTISNLSSITSGFGTLYTIITIIFALISLLIPILTYYFSIKPSRDIIRNFDSKVSAKFDEHIRQRVEHEVDEALSNLEKDKAESINFANNYRILAQAKSFSDMQVFKIVSFLRTAGTDMTMRYQLQSLIAFRESEFATSYFLDVLKSFSAYECTVAFRYFSRVGIERFTKPIRDFLNREKATGEPLYQASFFQMLEAVKSFSIPSLIKLCNNEALLEYVPRGNRATMTAQFVGLGENADHAEALRRTKFYQQLEAISW